MAKYYEGVMSKLQS